MSSGKKIKPTSTPGQSLEVGHTRVCCSQKVLRHYTLKIEFCQEFIRKGEAI